jgi:hypothetical protein
MASTILDVLENLRDFQFCLRPQGVACLLYELVDFRTAALPWWHTRVWKAETVRSIQQKSAQCLVQKGNHVIQFSMERRGRTFNSLKARVANVTDKVTEITDLSVSWLHVH